MTPSTLTKPSNSHASERLTKLFARVRRKQLETALAGDIRASARYARRAGLVRRMACQPR